MGDRDWPWATGINMSPRPIASPRSGTAAAGVLSSPVSPRRTRTGTILAASVGRNPYDPEDRSPQRRWEGANGESAVRWWLLIARERTLDLFLFYSADENYGIARSAWQMGLRAVTVRAVGGGDRIGKASVSSADCRREQRQGGHMGEGAVPVFFKGWGYS